MKKLTLLFIAIISLFTVTGCSVSSSSYYDMLKSIEEQENIVYTVTAKTEMETDSSSKYIERTEIYTFSDNYAIIVTEETYVEKNGKNYEKSYEHTEKIYDFEHGFVYTCVGKSGEYTQTTLWSTSTYEYMYSFNISTSSINVFFSDDVSDEYEYEFLGFTNFSKLSGTSSKITCKVSIEYDSESNYYSDDTKYEGSRKYVYNLKTTKISAPKDSKIISWA